jgi:catechol 2,3-dioxygenase-like lactoylglutathione lyase family enzyme
MISGFHHSELPVSDVTRNCEWYERVLGFTVDLGFVEDDVLRCVALAHDGLSGGIALRHDPGRAKALGVQRCRPASAYPRGGACLDGPS